MMASTRLELQDPPEKITRRSDETQCNVKVLPRYCVHSSMDCTAGKEGTRQRSPVSAQARSTLGWQAQPRPRPRHLDEQWIPRWAYPELSGRRRLVGGKHDRSRSYLARYVKSVPFFFKPRSPMLD